MFQALCLIHGTQINRTAVIKEPSPVHGPFSMSMRSK